MPCKTTKQKYGDVVAHDSHQNAYTIDLHHYLLFHKSVSLCGIIPVEAEANVEYTCFKIATSCSSFVTHMLLYERVRYRYI